MTQPFDLRQLLDFCSDSSGTIVGRACHDENDEKVFPCRHILGDTPTPNDLLVLDRLEPTIRESLERLFSTHKEVGLFVVDDEPGIVLASPHSWESLADEIGEWWHPARDELDPETVSALESAIVFGKVTSAATYFALIRSGELRGQVAVFAGPGLELFSIADSFDAFMRDLPRRGVEWMATDVRYRALDSAKQYLPIAYRKNGIAAASVRVVRVRFESEGTAAVTRLEITETTEDEVTVSAPSGRRYSLVIELYKNDEASIDVGDANDMIVYARGHGAMRLHSRLGSGDTFSAEVLTRPG